MRAGVYVYGLPTAGAGLMDLIWGEFESAHQPIQAWGDHISGQQIFAYITAVWLIVAGATILWRRTARAGAAALAILYFIFAVFWLPRFYLAPHVLGFRIPVFLGVSGGVAQQLVLVAGAAIVYVSAATRARDCNTLRCVGRPGFPSPRDDAVDLECDSTGAYGVRFSPRPCGLGQ